MALTAAHVTARYPARRLRELMNPDDLTATTGASTFLDQCCSDAEAAFSTYTGRALDTTETDQLSVAVDLAVGLAVQRSMGMPETWETAKNRAIELGKTTGRNRIVFTTSSELTPSTEVQPGETVTPKFDQDAFDGYAPSKP